MGFLKRRLAAALLAALVLLTGCAAQGEAEGEADQEEDQGTAEEIESYSDGRFTIQYDPEGSLDPFEDTNTYNDQMFSLVYEGLFALDDKLTPRPVLCESWDTQDGVTYTVTIKEGVSLHNGGELTASDAAWSINTARLSSKYASRLRCIETCTASDERTLTITLSAPNYMLPSLLDTPIVAAGSEGAMPPGTGPYRLSGSSLTAFPGYRQETGIDIIYLTEPLGDDVERAFSETRLDLIAWDPLGGEELNVHCVRETRYYHTSQLIYLAFNCQTGPFTEAPLRRAVSYLVDREHICSDILGSSVQSAPLALSPVLEFYDTAWEEGSGYSRESFSQAISETGLQDEDMDGYYDTSIRFIVNNDSPAKVSAARRITTDLQNMGLRVELAELSWEAYTAALAAGNFHMCLAEARLSADFDLTPLVGTGGRLNYGGYSSEATDGYISAYLASGDEASRAYNAGQLCKSVLEESPVVPIAYKQMAVMTHPGVVTGAAPSQSGLFTGAAGWGFHLD